jgi:hypothetical protein
MATHTIRSIRASARLVLALAAGNFALAGCAADYGRYGHGPRDWDAQHAQAHQRMMAQSGNAMCPWEGPGIGMGVSGMGMGAITPEQQRAMIAAHIKAMPPELLKQRMAIMEMHLQMMREQLASQPATAAPR